MKKTYMTPASTVVQLTAQEGLLAGSKITIGGTDKITDEGQVLVNNKGGWNSDSWTDNGNKD